MKPVLIGLSIPVVLIAIVTAITVLGSQVPSRNVVKNGNPQSVDIDFSDVNNNPPLERPIVKSLDLDDGNTIKIEGPITEFSVDIADQITTKSKNNKNIYILINSPGGSVLDGALIVSAIQQSQAITHTICLQLCASMAAIIFEYGNERLMVDRSTLMFHPASGSLQGTLGQMDSRLEFIKRYILKMDKYIAVKVGINLKDFLQKSESELWMDAEDSVAKGFADNIVNVTFTGSNQTVPLLSNKKDMINMNWSMGE